MSFAGQQDTYLNVTGENALLQAVVECWGSLWTARAIGYRARNHINVERIALAVFVQRMVESEVSGVLFTANPLTGLSSETVIDATIGLGEALVSGLVEPDHYVVDTEKRQIKTRKLGAKLLSIHGKPGGGTERVEAKRETQQALADSQILALTDLGQHVANLYKAPQDIEWALANDRLYLLQARPVTSLFPTPERMIPYPLKVFFSFGAVQGMLDPITPLGRDALRVVFAMGGRLFGYDYTSETQPTLAQAGERLWVNITPLIRNTVGRKIARAAFSYVEPTVEQALGQIWEDPDLRPAHQGVRPRALLRIVRFLVPFFWNVLLNMRAPRKRRETIIEGGETILRDLRNRCSAIQGDARTKLGEQANIFSDLAKSRLPRTLLQFVSLVATGMASFNLLRVLATRLPERVNGGLSGGWPNLVLEIVRGLPNNPTTEMDLALWQIAREIRGSDERMLYFQQPSSKLAAQYKAGTMPDAARKLIEPFLERYGGRGLAEIDMGRTRWSEDPQHIIEVVAGFTAIRDDDQAPNAAFARGAVAAQAAIDSLCGALRKLPGGWFKAHAALFAARRVRELLGARESPKFFAVRMMSIVRNELLLTGAELKNEGVLECADDLFFLTFAEMRMLAAGEPQDWKILIALRRKVYQREMLRRQVPRLLLSDGRAFFEGMRPTTESANTLTGSPVSPGAVEGCVRVVFDPRKADLHPGEIMVCPGTDPSWTPLFLTAAGLVMEVGGMMTHGAVVAREYGIPAVVGVDQATKRLVDGQRIRVDGSNGIIIILEEKEIA